MWTMSRPTVVTAAYEAPSTPRASRHKPHVEGSYAKAAEQFQRPRAGTVRAKAQAAAEFVRAGNGCVVDALAKFGIAKQRFSEVAPMQRPAEPTEETRSMMIDGVMYEYQHKIGPCRSVAEDKTVKENRAKFNWREKQKAFKRAAAAAATAAAEFDGVEAAELRRCADEGYDHEEDGEDPVRADLLALNARHPKIKAPKEHTLTQRIISNARTVAGRLISSMRLRSVGHALEGNEALPHDASALDEHTLSLIINEQTGEETKAVCVDCAHETSFSVGAAAFTWSAPAIRVLCYCELSACLLITGSNSITHSRHICNRSLDEYGVQPFPSLTTHCAYSSSSPSALRSMSARTSSCTALISAYSSAVRLTQPSRSPDSASAISGGLRIIG